MSSTIQIDIHKGKLITFDLDVQGLDRNTLNGKFRIIFGGIEYGFPVTIKNQQVKVSLPHLRNVIHDIKGGSIEAKLEVFTDHNYFVPWEGKLKMVEPVSVKAKVSIKKPKVRTIKTEDVEVDEQAEIIVDDPEEEVTLPEPKRKKKIQTESSIIITEDTKSEYLERLKKIDEEGIRSYMKNAGTSSDSVQNIILEKADEICKDSDNKFELLKSVVKVMRQFKTGGKK